MENDSNLKTPIIANTGGYLMYPESLMMGFAKTMYFSKNAADLESIIDYQTSHSASGFYQEDLPKGVSSGNFAKSLQDGVNFNILSEDTTLGRKPNDLDEIVISDTLYKALELQSLEETIYVATSKKEMLVD